MIIYNLAKTVYSHEFDLFDSDYIMMIIRNLIWRSILFLLLFFWDSCYFFWFGCLRNICLYQPCFQRRGKKSWWRRRFFKEDVPWRRRQEGILPPESRIYGRQSPTDRWPCIHIPVAQSQKKLSKTWWFFFKHGHSIQHIYIYKTC